MAIALGNATYSNLNPGSSSQTLSHTSNNGTDTLLFVSISMQNTVSVTGMTYGGVPMTQIQQTNFSGIAKRTASYFLINPPSGGNNIIINFSGGQFNPTAIFARTFTGAGGIGNFVSSGSQPTPNSENITIAQNSILFLTGISGASQNFGYVVAGSTRTNVGNGFNINNIVEGAWSQTGLPAGVTNVQTVADVNNITNVTVEIQEAGGAPPTTRRRMWVT